NNSVVFFFQAEDGIRDRNVTGVQTCALPIYMWIHEGFTSYGEALYVEYFFGKEAGQAYTRGTRDRIANLSPIQGKYGIHDTPSSDMYFKGANMLLTLRQFINDDILWRKILHHIQEKFKYTTIDSKTIESEISKLAQIDLT